jgi:RNA polymerase sigma-70 factor (ECF subfamily)
MTDHDFLAEQFEAKRAHLRAVAYRMLGSISEAEDAVQESWLHVSRSDPRSVENMGGWLTTIVARVCLDLLRSRKSRREEPLGPHGPESTSSYEEQMDPEHEVVLADSLGTALLVVLETLAPAERLAFVLHDMFAVSFDEIAPIVGRTPTAARQLASRARRRVQGASPGPEIDVTRQREIVTAFLAAARGGDFAGLLAVLDPDVVFRNVVPKGQPSVIRGAAAVAEQFLGKAHGAEVGLVNGSVGLVVAIAGTPRIVLNLTLRNGKITEIETIMNRERLRQMDVSVFSD